MSGLSPCLLGDRGFRTEHGVRLAYVAGAMTHGIASTELVCRMARARLLSFLGTGGMGREQVEKDLQRLRASLDEDAPWGVNHLCNLDHPAREEEMIELYLKYRVRTIEAAAFTQVTRSLVLYRVRGLTRANGTVEVANRIMAKVSRPEVARQFLEPPPERLVRKLLEEGRIAPQEAELARSVPMADDICVEADSGGHTDKGVAYCLVPVVIGMRDQICKERRYSRRIRVGTGGGLGTPSALAASFVLGAEFVVTGSINQATVEAGTSEAVKDMLQVIGPQDTAMAPAGDMFELGAKVQVLSRGVLFPARANKLYDLYRTHGSLDAIDANTQRQIQDKFFHRSFAEVRDDVRRHYERTRPSELEKIARDPKCAMAKVFRWYFAYCNRIALQGDDADRANYQVCCGPALGAFNQWVAGTQLESWRHRHVDELAEVLMQRTADVLSQRLMSYASAD